MCLVSSKKKKRGGERETSADSLIEVSPHSSYLGLYSGKELTCDEGGKWKKVQSGEVTKGALIVRAEGKWVCLIAAD